MPKQSAQDLDYTASHKMGIKLNVLESDVSFEPDGVMVWIEGRDLSFACREELTAGLTPALQEFVMGTVSHTLLQVALLSKIQS